MKILSSHHSTTQAGLKQNPAHRQTSISRLGTQTAKRLRRVLGWAVAATVLAMAVAASFTWLTGCGLPHIYILFSFSSHPDLPVQKFAQGNLGILQPRYSPAYLFLAHRSLSGKPPADWEFEQMKDYWSAGGSEVPGQPHASQAIRMWRESVLDLTGQDVLGAQVYRPVPGGWNRFLNCPADAFLTASSTLHDRAARFGAASPALQTWLEGQVQVFENCSDSEPVIPAPAASGWPEIIRHDRVYQRAAAYFYSMDFDRAQQLFESIADTPESPWHPIAPYLAARCSIRRGTLFGPLTRSLQDAEKRLRAVLADPRQEAMHQPARGLLRFILFRIRPGQLQLTLEERLLNPDANRWSVEDLQTYSRLSRRGLRNPHPGHLQRWIEAVQSSTAARSDQAVEIWRQNPTPAWTVAALMSISATDARLPQLLEQAEQIAPDSPAFASAAFYRGLLLWHSGQDRQARQAVDRALSRHPQRFPPSSLNAMRALRARLAPTLEDFLRDAARRPVALAAGGSRESILTIPEGTDRFQGQGWNYYIANRRQYFDRDVTWVLGHRLSLDTLLWLGLEHDWQPHLRLELLQAAWVRAVLLERPGAALHAAKALLDLRPGYRDGLRSYLEEPEERRELAAWLLLARLPGLSPEIGSGLMRRRPPDRIDNYGDNWPCYPSAPHQVRGLLARIHPKIEEWRPEFLTAEDRRQAAAEQEKLIMLPAAPDLIADQAVRLARRFPDDPRAPEILHLAVRSTRYGCRSSNEGQGSRAAFRLLHQGYPDSSWAKKTPYWFR